jgi:hypothetical protein
MLACGLTATYGGANPQIPFYGGNGTITATPHYPIVGEPTEIQVVVGNSGDADASNVQVKISFNDWGVTFQGWQEIRTVTIPSIPVGGTDTVTVTKVFENSTHTCVEALIVGADEDQNPGDDRGQINLEVIHAGETFSYGVPIRNNGDDPVLLVLCAHRVDANPDPNGDVPCKQDQQDPILLEPGEEMILPVEIQVAPGETVRYRVDAFNLLSDDPFGSNNHNHVELEIIGTTAQALKKTAIATIDTARQSVVSRPLSNRMSEVSKHIQHALNSKSWSDPDRLGRGGAAMVFAQEIVAVKQIEELLKTDLDLASKEALNTAALQLTDADRIIAQTANNDIGGDPQASALIQKGDEFRELGEYPKAVANYSLAWNAATQ